METSISLYKLKSNKPYPIRLLKYNNTCIDENHEVSNISIPSSVSPSVSFPITHADNSEFQTLIHSYNEYMSAKLAYERAANAFWKSETGVRCASYLAPDPLKQDRTLLESKIKELDVQLAKQSIQVKYRNVEISGYTYILATYIIIMYETQAPPPQVFNDFILKSSNERIIEEIPKVWTNKTVLHRKKEFELLYVSGTMLPPYRYADMSAAAAAM